MNESEQATSFDGDPPAAADQTALPDRKELALVAVERTRMPMVVSDARQPDNPIVLANHAFLDLTGYAADEVIGRNCRFLQGPDTDPSAVNEIRRGLAENPDHISVELLNYRKDGSSFWNELVISPVRDEAGHVIYYFASQKDVTARRRAKQMEETEHLLLMEVDHRAMNALALVQSIVRLSRTDTVAGYASSIVGRVDAMARAHRLLARDRWTGVDLGELLKGEMPEGSGERIEACGPPLQVPAVLVQPLALVLHELVANAGKHGGLASQDGSLHVEWEQASEDMLLRWQERGSKRSIAPSRPGFGLAMVVGVVERQLGGKVDLAWSDEGLRAEMRLPVHGQSGETGHEPN